MKKYTKAAALALVLCLCLILTGCYIAPDDVNTNTTNPGNNVPFNTLAPAETETITPDTIAVDTQNVWGNPTPTASQEGVNGWNQWPQETGPSGSGGTATPIPGTIEFTTESPAPGTVTTTDGGITVITSLPPTATPTPAQATPTPTPQSLQKGFKGSEAVRSVQKRLKELGYYKGSADGDFGDATEKAVIEFQKANGLKADGKVGEQTLKKLNSKDAKSYKEAHATATPKVTATPKPTATPNLSKDYWLKAGSSGKRVETLQRRLIELGWLDGNVTGTYDSATEEAVRAFQRKTSGLWEDGIAGPDTLRALYSSNAARSKKAASSTGTSSNPETLEFGSEGEAVRKMQQKLKDLGYLSGSADGKFGVATQAAVIAFQKRNNLTADGKAGTATLNKLYSGTANRASGTSAKIGNKNSSGRDTSDIASTGYETLENGSQGEAVRKLQKRLKELGYYGGNTDGSFGDATEAAVMAFQLQNNLTVDGKAGPATQRALYGTGSDSPVSYSALRMGDTGKAVRNLQYTLYELGYYDGSIDGDFGQTTSDAVRAFQIQNGLSVDGVAGSDTLARLYSSNAVAATAAAVSYDTVRPGDEGDTVVQIQDCLVQMGYLDKVTGVYDDATTEAVRLFQQANGLTPDGVAGSKTLVILFGY